MNAIAWVVLTLVAGAIFGGLVLSLTVAGRSGRVSSRPVWQVMLERGIDGRPKAPESEVGKEELELPTAPSSTTTVPEPVQLARERSEENAREQNTEQL